MISRRRAALSTFAGGLGNVFVVAAQTTVLVPLILRSVGARLYGAWLGSGDLLLWLQAFDLGLPNLLTQRVAAAHGAGDDVGAVRWLVNGLVALACASALIIVAGLWVAPHLPGWFHVTGTDGSLLQRAVLVGTVAAAAVVFNNGFVGFSRGVQRTGFLNVVMLAASLASFGTSLGMLLGGFGLLALPSALAVRAGIGLLGSIVFVVREVPALSWRTARIDRRLLGEMLRVTPLTAVGGLAYAAMNQCELALVGSILGPTEAATYMITRKVAELARAFSDMVSFSSYGAFAHLVTSNAGHRAMTVYLEIRALRTTLSVVGVAAYVAMNASLVGAWVGNDRFGGVMLTLLIGAQSIAVGDAFFTNYLYRAGGAVAQGSAALAVEAVIRVTLMALLIPVIGLAGVPVAGLCTASAATILTHRWQQQQLAGAGPHASTRSLHAWALRGAVLATGTAVGINISRPDWISALSIGAVVAVVGTVTLVSFDPSLATFRASAHAALQRWRPTRGQAP